MRSRTLVSTGVCAIALGLGSGCADPELPPGEFDVWVGSDDGDGARADPPGEPVARCEGKTRLRYDPLSGAIDALPDDVLTEDADTVTGVRIRDLRSGLPEEDPFAGFPSVLDGLATLEGFATAAPLFVRVDGPVDPYSLPPPGMETAPGSSLVLLDLDAEPPVPVAFGTRIVEENFNDESATLFVDPLLPLRPQGHYALAITQAVTDLDGDCIAPSDTMAALLDGAAEHPTLTRLAGRYEAATAALLEAGAIEDPGELSGLYVFTTAEPTLETLDIAEVIAGASPPPITYHPDCLDASAQPWRQCEVVLKIADFTDDEGVVAEGVEPQRFVDLPVSAFFPPQGDGPFPTVIFGHGLGGDRSNAWQLALALAGSGYAVVAIDAPKHGDHPDGFELNEAFSLFGLTSDPLDPFHPLDARDNFRQATFDKLQLLQRIRKGFDADGDGKADVDPGELYYVGNSLGAVMASQFLALAPEVHAAVLVVGGARLTDIVKSDEFIQLVNLVTPDLTDGMRERFLTATQVVLERGEPDTYAGHVLGDRLAGFDGDAPQVLAQMALDDTIVTNTSTSYLVRSLGLPVVGNVSYPIRDVDQDPALPIVGNLEDGRTGGLYQYPEVLVQGSTSIFEPATHYNVQSDPGALDQLVTFLESSSSPGGATIIEPYR